ncbi:HDOD domain-containing protein [Desulfomicrobium baculatum]|uniref:Putative signal transduction protein n=1 Tax=Desulfomicrobium baculatum (strain DSM 4028 / VKM B-1378 / X) TaxID=525897 RepID=C7LNB1_DESBD|nr:HDOD domain-containing protein [Desulfomicrobium baculatum]ACU90080.1 putative signal transduction protein [Desulfomicrobium baculatum DSM 4028]
MHSVKRLAHIDFNIPGVKAVGMELMRLINSPNPDMEAFARTVELDPAIFGSILACANSPLFAGIAEISDLRVALNRLGMKEIRRIIFHVVLESAFRSDNAEINKLLRAIWKQNLAVSLTMQRLIQECPQVKALPMEMVSMIYPLGLMHVIGIPVLAINFYEPFAKFIHEDLSRPLPEIYAREKELFDGFDHFELGAELIKRWGFPDFVPDIISTYHVPEPSLDAHSRTLHSLLRFARHLAQELGFAALPGAPEGFWLESSTLDVSKVNTQEIMADVTDQLKKITAMF